MNERLYLKNINAYKGIYNRYIKRFIGLVLSVISLILVLPLYLIISITIILDSGFPVLYKPLRGGYKGRPFRMYKFRTMVKNADTIGGGTTALNDKRITRTGKILRKIKLDEITNLINIVKGDMSFIGPRPELLRYTEKYTGMEKLILQVRPGITDYSSIEYINLDEIVGSENADEEYEKKVLKRKNRLRIKYATTVSFTTDVKLFMLTLVKIIGRIQHIGKKRANGVA